MEEKKYKIGTKLLVTDNIGNEHNDPFLTSGNIVIVRKSRRYKDAYDFEEAPTDNGWVLSHIEDLKLFTPLSWKVRYGGD